VHCAFYPLGCNIYVGYLGNNGNNTELALAFGYYGPLRSVWVARDPLGSASVAFEDPGDAAGAVQEPDGGTRCGCRGRVEPSKGERRRNCGPPLSGGHHPRGDHQISNRSWSRSLSRDRRRERPLSQERNHPSRAFPRSGSRSKSHEGK
uniref:RRM domain-containing protein n=1 Tax=Otolemur garnettii TaxID=30611 RepID=H0XW28_OTOGA